MDGLTFSPNTCRISPRDGGVLLQYTVSQKETLPLSSILYLVSKNPFLKFFKMATSMAAKSYKIPYNFCFLIFYKQILYNVVLIAQYQVKYG
jgi:hypothetical protein